MTTHYNQLSTRSRRRRLRRDATAAERKLWAELRRGQLGVRFHRQYAVDSYILDFYAPRAKLAVEVDGDTHAAASAREYDARRTALLSRYAIEVLRFSNGEVCAMCDAVVATILEAVQRRKSG